MVAGGVFVCGPNHNWPGIFRLMFMRKHIVDRTYSLNIRYGIKKYTFILKIHNKNDLLHNNYSDR